MASITLPISIAQVADLVRQLTPQEQRALLATLTAERFDAAAGGSDARRGEAVPLSDAEIQAEIDAVRQGRFTGGRDAARD